MKRAYLDWNATAPLRPEARAAMIEAMDVVGNPSSVHAEGRAAKMLVERARAQVAAAIGAVGADVVFVSGATEAAALACRERETSASPIEHDAVASWDVSDGDLRDHWHFSEAGALEPLFGQGLYEVSLEGGDLLAVTAANSETGIITDTAAFAMDSVGGGARHHLLVDATQAFGKTAFDFDQSGADMALCSAHKIGGPKGVGALVLRRGQELAEQIRGGGQEMGRRSGTENVIGIAGFGAAAEAAAQDFQAGVWGRVEKLRNILENTIAASADQTIFVGKDAGRLPNTSCFITPGWKGETQVMSMDLAGFAVSAGSACSSGKVTASRVLRAMGYSEVDAASAIRVSLGPTTIEDEVLRFCEAWQASYTKFRARAA